MNYYEELGVPPDAPLETIRDAYRNLARLLHPDVQTDPVLKESAEAQMKRVNLLYGILSDPVRRRRYDLRLVELSEHPAPVFVPAPPREDPFEPGINGAVVWLAATAVCAAFIIWLAVRESSSSPAVYPPGGFSSQVSAPQTPSPAAPALRAAAVSAKPVNDQHPVDQQRVDQQRDDELQTLRGKLLAANADRQRLENQMAAHEVARKTANLDNLAPAPLVAPTTAPEIAPAVLPPAVAPQASTVHPRWSGAWAYHPVRNEKRKHALFPPEFIEAVIHEEEGRIRGQYHARFKTTGVRICPDVDFRFEGKISGMSGRLFWIGAGGAKGEVLLRLVSDTALEIVWSATDLGTQMGLASGTAVLNRAN